MNWVAEGLLFPLEQVVNLMVSQDPVTASRLSLHAGRSVGLHTDSPAMQIRIQILEQGLRLSTDFTDACDAYIRGPSRVLLGMMTRSTASARQVPQQVQLNGDLELLESIFDTLTSMPINWQDPLSRVLGDVLTHGIERSTRAARDWGQDSVVRVTHNLDAWLHIESRLLPDRAEIADYHDRLDALKLRLDRLEARLSLRTNAPGIR